MNKIQTLINKDTALVALLDIKIKDITDKRSVLLAERRWALARIRANSVRL